MLKKIETEETVVFFVTFLSLVAFQLGEGLGPPPLATPVLRLIFSRNLGKSFHVERIMNNLVSCLR